MHRAAITCSVTECSHHILDFTLTCKMSEVTDWQPNFHIDIAPTSIDILHYLCVTVTQFWNFWAHKKNQSNSLRWSFNGFSMPSVLLETCMSEIWFQKFDCAVRTNEITISHMLYTVKCNHVYCTLKTCNMDSWVQVVSYIDFVYVCVTREQSYGLLWNTLVEDQPWTWYAWLS